MKNALISPCGLYRYHLTRMWKGADKVARFIMLNPSTADAEVDDPTIRRCIAFAQREGCGALQVVNLFALRSKSPSDLLKSNDPVGPENDKWLGRIVKAAMADWDSGGGPLIAA